MAQTFLSYAREDESFALPLARALASQGADIWVDQWCIEAGADWDRAIDDALYDCTYFLIVMSPRAVDKVEVRGELRTALDTKKKVVTILHEPVERLPRVLRLFQYVDFTGRPPDDPERLGQILAALDVIEGGTVEPRFVSLAGLPDAERTNLSHVLERYEVFMGWLHQQAETPERQPEVVQRVADYGAILRTSQVFPLDSYLELIADIGHLELIVEDVFEGELSDYVTGTAELRASIERALAAIERFQELLF